MEFDGITYMEDEELFVLLLCLQLKIYYHLFHFKCLYWNDIHPLKQNRNFSDYYTLP